MKKSLLVLSVLFIFGACSTAVDLPNGVKGTGDSVLDTGIKDSLNQIGSTQGLSQWTTINTQRIEGATVKSAHNYFLGTDTFKEILVTSQDGTLEGETFNNKVLSQIAAEGTFSSLANFKIFRVDSSTTNDITKEFTAKGFTRIFTVADTKRSVWFSRKGAWESKDNETHIYIAKEDDNELTLIFISHLVDDQYATINTVDEAITKALVYKKQ
ncbi:MAG: hypothetical protein ACRCWI_01635 [Brevinema sp.]